MHEFFPGVYPWNLAIHLALQMGGVLSEIERETQPLLRFRAASEPGAAEAWMSAWARMGDRAAAAGHKDLAAGHGRSGGKKLLRASLYAFMAERLMHVAQDGRRELYQAGLERFRSGIEAMREAVEFVEIPYEGTTLPALYVHPKTPPLGGAPGPCMVFFDGFDVNKEFLYYRGPREELVQRGVALLCVDTPGVGAALRLRGLHAVVDTERAGKACVDWLLHRRDVDPTRVGIMGVSLGGYYAPRAAAYEKRFACCVAWGAANRFGDRIARALAQRDGGNVSVADMVEHARWVFGAKDDAELVQITRRFTLDDAATHITCPFLITHGENDRQVPVSEARAVHAAAVNSPRRELRIFTAEEGGAEHVNFDHPDNAVDHMADWIVDVLGGKSGPGSIPTSRSHST